MDKEFFLSIGNIFFYYVNGEYIRNTFTSEFEGGGNWLRYKFIPQSEIWVAKTNSNNDDCITAMHEYIEVLNIQLGNNYDESHVRAAAFEDFIRNNKSAGQNVGLMMTDGED